MGDALKPVMAKELLDSPTERPGVTTSKADAPTDETVVFARARVPLPQTIPVLTLGPAIILLKMSTNIEERDVR